MECASSSLDNNTASAMEGMDCDPETEAVEERECYQGEADMRRFPVRTGDLNSFVRQGGYGLTPPIRTPSPFCGVPSCPESPAPQVQFRTVNLSHVVRYGTSRMSPSRRVQVSWLLPDFYEVNEIVGSGAFGVVAIGTDKRNHLRIAIKRAEEPFRDPVLAKRMVREVTVLRQLCHPNVIRLYDLIQIPSFESLQDAVYMSFERAETTLGDVLKKSQDPYGVDLKLSVEADPSRFTLTDENRCKWMYQLLKALKYIHSRRVVHRDIKPDNLLLDKMGDIKLGDFGLARTMYSDLEDADIVEELGYHPEPSKLTLYVVTRWYRPPEVLLRHSCYTPAVDVWSAGCVLAEMFTGGVALFRGNGPLNQLMRIFGVLGTPSAEDVEDISCPEALRWLREQPPLTGRGVRGALQPFIQAASSSGNKSRPIANGSAKSASDVKASNEQAMDLLEQMLTFHPKDRISVEDALQHPYFAEMRKGDQQLHEEQGASRQRGELQASISAAPQSTASRLEEMVCDLSPSQHPPVTQPLRSVPVRPGGVIPSPMAAPQPRRALFLDQLDVIENRASESSTRFAMSDSDSDAGVGRGYAGSGEDECDLPRLGAPVNRCSSMEEEDEDEDEDEQGQELEQEDADEDEGHEEEEEDMEVEGSGSGRIELCGNAMEEDIPEAQQCGGGGGGGGGDSAMDTDVRPSPCNVDGSMDAVRRCLGNPSAGAPKLSESSRRELFPFHQPIEGQGQHSRPPHRVGIPPRPPSSSSSSSTYGGGCAASSSCGPSSSSRASASGGSSQTPPPYGGPRRGGPSVQNRDNMNARGPAHHPLHPSGGTASTATSRTAPVRMDVAVPIHVDFDNLDLSVEESQVHLYEEMRLYWHMDMPQLVLGPSGEVITLGLRPASPSTATSAANTMHLHHGLHCHPASHAHIPPSGSQLHQSILVQETHGTSTA